MEAPTLAEQAQHVLGYCFKDQDLLRESLTHSSIADTRKESNERLEFLGDSVLGLVVCHRLYEMFPDYLEGDLTKLKSAVVSRQTCAQVSNEIGLTELILVGKGMTGRADRPSSLAAGALESVIAAIYLDGGFAAAEDFVLRMMNPYIQQFASTSHQQNFKSLLQQYAQKTLNSSPQYELLDEKGPDHSKCFEVRVVIQGRGFCSAWGPAKKIAEQKAAQNALEELGVLVPEHVGDPSAPVEEPMPPENNEDQDDLRAMNDELMDE